MVVLEDIAVGPAFEMGGDVDDDVSVEFLEVEEFGRVGQGHAAKGAIVREPAAEERVIVQVRLGDRLESAEVAGDEGTDELAAVGVAV